MSDTGSGSAPISPITPPGVSLGKGRPTPKRSEKERRTGPVPPPPRTRKEAAQRQREQQASTRRTGGPTGGEVRMLARDQGPVRALVRDVVDSRRNIGVLLLPLALLLVATNLYGDPEITTAATQIWTGGLLALFIDLVLLTVRVRRTVRAEFPAEKRLGRHAGYAALRSTVMRRLRMPPPRVSPGDVVGTGSGRR